MITIPLKMRLAYVAVFTLIAGTIGLVGVNLAALGPNGECNQQEYEQLRGDCTFVPNVTDPLSNNVIGIKSLDSYKSEGNSGATPFTFTVSRSSNVTGVSTTNWFLQGLNTGQNSGTVTFASGETAKTITINFPGNTAVEPDKNFSVCLTDVNNARIDKDGICARGVVRNDDKPNPCGYNTRVAVATSCYVAGANLVANTPAASSVRLVAQAATGVSSFARTVFPQQPPAEKKVIVTMGDSYEVGVYSLLPNIFGCYRQNIQSSDIVAKELGMVSNNVACGGAMSAEIISGIPGRAPESQLKALDQKNVALVILSAGGNDVILPSNAIQCFYKLICLLDGPEVTTAEKQIDGLWNSSTHTGSLATLYSAIRQRTKATVLVEGYPVYASPEAATTTTTTTITRTTPCPRNQGRSSCTRSHTETILKKVPEAPGCDGMTNTERSGINKLMSRLNSVVREAANYYNFVFVEPYAPDAYNYGTDQMCAVSNFKPVTAPLELPVPWHPSLSGVQRRAQRDIDTVRTLQRMNSPLSILAL